ncbi:hypothetical protein BGW38_007593 [Lunasporangiospora selenospora]|uniref:Mitochondrial import inner membrane translocase subunit TIM50 n=1 Tax=Lunasporangiospora selenospora TaxID=979761 RepID=A0A9P6FYT3_9FUNG|nr:hypothetical protein BGW38_007593 [Lunasporangiospora selenospora]
MESSPPISPNGAASVYYNEETKTFFPTNPIRSITPSYLTVAAQEPSALASPQKLLVILDLNGTLFYRNKNNKRNVTSRPYLQEFLDFIFESCRVMVWSSAQPHSVETMLSYGFDQRSSLLDRVWTREDFRLPRSDYIKKVLTIKDLEFVWEGIELEKKRAREGKRRSQQQIFSKEEKIAETVASLEVLDEKYSIHFDQTNTVLIDDSHDKSQLQPHNCLVLRDFDENLARAGNDDELLRVKQYLQKLVYQSNVSAYMSRQPYDSNALLEDPAPRKLANRRSSTKDHFVIVDPVADHLK